MRDLASSILLRDAMRRIRKRKCLYCKEYFEPDVRNAKKQKCCRNPDCRKAQKAEHQATWVANNPGCFSGPENVARVQAWREENPGYSRNKRPEAGEPKRKRKPGRTNQPQSAAEALQEALVPQATDSEGDSATLPQKALQEALRVQGPVLIGLIAHLTDSTLQDDIAATARRLLQLGQDILSGTHPDASAPEPKDNAAA
jgi:hypothetical protein